MALRKKHPFCEIVNHYLCAQLLHFICKISFTVEATTTRPICLIGCTCDVFRLASNWVVFQFHSYLPCQFWVLIFMGLSCLVWTCCWIVLRTCGSVRTYSPTHFALPWFVTCTGKMPKYSTITFLVYRSPSCTPMIFIICLICFHNEWKQKHLFAH